MNGLDFVITIWQWWQFDALFGSQWWLADVHVSSQLPLRHHVTPLLPKAFCFWLLTGKISPRIHSSFMYILYFCESLGQTTDVHTACTQPACYLWVQVSLLQCYLMNFAVFDFWPYSSALHTFLVCIKGLSLTVTVCNSFALKVSWTREEVSIRRISFQSLIKIWFL